MNVSETLEVRSGVKSRDTLKAKRAGDALALRIEFLRNFYSKWDI